MIKKIKYSLSNSESIKNVVVVITGTALSQLIALSATPFLTRNYIPSDFGKFTAFISVFTILTSFVTGKFERAILLAKTKFEIKIISSLVLAIGLAFSSILGIIILLYSIFWDYDFLSENNGLNTWYFCLPLFLIVHTINIVFLTYLNYRKAYKEISRSKILKTLFSVSISLLCIYFYNNVGGLILGELFGLVISTFYLFPGLRRLFQFDNKSLLEFKKYVSRYRNFPAYNIPSDLLNTSSSQLPIFFLSSLFGASVTGQYSLMKRIIDAPLNLLSNSILDVFRQKASQQYLENGNCRNLFLRTAKNLVVISFIPFFLLMLFGPSIFELVFGSEWQQAGKYASIFAFFYFFKFVSSPLSYIFIIAEKQKIDFILHIYIFASSFSIFYFADLLLLSVDYTLIVYSLNFTFIYILYFLLSLKFTVK